MLARAEARQLLRPGGQLALWWNIYAGPDGLGPLADAVKPLLASLPMPPSISATDHYSLNESLHRRSRTCDDDLPVRVALDKQQRLSRIRSGAFARQRGVATADDPLYQVHIR